MRRRLGLIVAFFVGATLLNTMRWLKLAPADLPKGFQVAERGGVVKLAELQQKGFAFIRP